MEKNLFFSQNQPPLGPSRIEANLYSIELIAIFAD